MEAKDRRAGILQLLRNRTAPITGGELAGLMGVSRQVIVQDVALLRSAGTSIFATPEGYLLPAATQQAAARRVIAAQHKGNEAMRDELTIVVDMGGTVVDVAIEHGVYGEFSAPLMIRSRMGVDVFMSNFDNGDTSPISMLTGGVHLHTIEAESEEIIDRIIEKLSEKGYILE